MKTSSWTQTLNVTQEKPNKPNALDNAKYIQKITELENKLIESDSRNLQLDKIIKNLYVMIDELKRDKRKSNNDSYTERKNSSLVSDRSVNDSLLSHASIKPRKPKQDLPYYPIPRRVTKTSSEARLN